MRHDLIRQAVYVALLPERRQYLHKLAGELLEQLSEESLDKIMGELAHHFLETGEMSWGRALHYSLRAGEGAQKVYANSEAIAHFQQAVELAERLKDKDALRIALRNLSHLCVHSGRVDEGLAYGQKALELTKDPHERAHIHETMADGYNYKIEHEKALACCERAIKDLGKQDKSLEMAKILNAGALMLCQLRRTKEAVEYCERALKILKKHDALYITAKVYANLGLAHRAEDLDKALEYELRAVEFSEKSQEISVVAEAYYALGLSYSLKRDGSMAMDWLRKALLSYEQLGDVTAVIWVHRLMCWSLIQCSNLDEAMKHALNGLELVKQLTDVYEKASVYGCMACLYYDKGLKKEADELFTKAQELARTDEMLYRNIIITYTLLGRFDDAIEWLKRSQIALPIEQLMYTKSHHYLESLRGYSKFKSWFSQHLAHLKN
ncbi:tetratricopeptide repeat protein [Candidatus Acetothermia bacterium]|nr:tetratricopeptide repeat protein [Candidatus Acetothermia bacterium]